MDHQGGEAACVDPVANLQCASKAFVTKWCDPNGEPAGHIRDVLHFIDVEDEPVQWEPSELAVAVAAAKCKGKYDSEGIFLAAISVAILVAATLWCAFFAKLANIPDLIAQLEVNSRIMAKKKGTVTANDTRAILPQGCWAMITHALIFNRIIDPLRQFLNTINCDGLLLGTMPGFQPLDVTFPLQTACELAIDSRSTWSICQAVSSSSIDAYDD
jgi:hypothetical protein